ncbi:hypothetical protein QYF50_06880 [Paenibacillus vini]|uniref:hypothetical protein n=1 Tax=Paenibacillus vini TaxID=1476024 RepID=UPI0025B6D09E|nr:hypothetical protein [Paenibacillus vini]MDN4067615.1 hypothetical protein [Paenibacillus vini]
MNEQISNLVNVYKQDKESVYRIWFLNNEERLKAFRTIRNGLFEVIDAIENRTFGNDFKGSVLETVITAISEQKQIFTGAAHAFYWKPKLRVPDIYENESNQLAFGRFLKACISATNEKQVLQEIVKLDQLKIKGLGPAVANILYFLHPTLFPPFNTAIVNGFNTLFNMKMKLGSWSAYLEMRDLTISLNEKYRDQFSKDLGAISGLLFEIGSGRYVCEHNAEVVIASLEQDANQNWKKRHQEVLMNMAEENEHSEMQAHLAKVGSALGYKVWIAQNDHRREWNGKKLGEFSIPVLDLPAMSKQTAQTISLIDVLWIDEKNHIVSAFEVEKSTSIYSGILRLHDLSISVTSHKSSLYLVAPDNREKEIKAQLLRPSFQQGVQFPHFLCAIL